MSASTASTLVLVAFIFAIIATVILGSVGAFRLISALSLIAMGFPPIIVITPLILIAMCAISIYVVFRTYKIRDSLERGNISYALRLLSIPFCILALFFSGLITGILLFVARGELSRIQPHPSREIYAEGEEIEW